MFLSLLVHAIFVFWLAYVLAFKAAPRIETKTDDPPPLTLLPPPPPPPPKVEGKPPTFVPELAPRIVSVHTDVHELPIPPVIEPRRPPSAVATDDHPIVMQPRVISLTSPAYPEQALDGGISGHVDIEGTVAPDGSFSDGAITIEDPAGYGFAKALLKVIPKWKFEPRTVNGIAVPYRIRYRFRFALTP